MRSQCLDDTGEHLAKLVKGASAARTAGEQDEGQWGRVWLSRPAIKRIGTNKKFRQKYDE